MSSEIVSFGKHKGKTFEDAAKDDPYVCWALGVSDPSGPLKHFQEYLLSRLEESTPSSNRKRESTDDHFGSKDSHQTLNSFISPKKMRISTDSQPTSPTSVLSENINTDYVRRTMECWSCHKTTSVYSWKNHIWMQTEMDPLSSPEPKNINWRYTKTAGISYWANTCEHCNSVQGLLPASMRGGGVPQFESCIVS
ncbi:hypothetical protein CEUSTIGMA_g7766.t1 [Chlamydomonas eustigma]|uniref:Uncharacterized protein n=1 Tax=Chlamydomonas eustigma TaxID=1157962 RepID=A0A250XB75_9CHLO|nr:hypothetical protein CEUSTIGMA_g7766.t1 [Chlamydomonas eustigma]|eukprot:GAX80328.1 hypothetical protein CEUSTIGMA_g7766.t1 [Chlamydomonas eustigma]